MSHPSRQRSQLWPALGVTAASLIALFTWVDLSPRVEGDFFFSPDDPQYLASAEIADRFPQAEQVIVRASAPDIHTEKYRTLVDELTRTLAAAEGVADVSSVANKDATDSPLWRRVLTTPNADATRRTWPTRW